MENIEYQSKVFFDFSVGGSPADRIKIGSGINTPITYENFRAL